MGCWVSESNGGSLCQLSGRSSGSARGGRIGGTARVDVIPFHPSPDSRPHGRSTPSVAIWVYVSRCFERISFTAFTAKTVAAMERRKLKKTPTAAAFS